MRDTPRTDAAEIPRKHFDGEKWTMDGSGKVSCDFARQLERELAEARSGHERVLNMLIERRNELTTLREGVEKLVKEVENRNPISAAKLRALLK